MSLRARLRGRSFGEIVSLVVKNIVYAIWRFRPGAVAARRADLMFDREWGTDTSGNVNLTSLELDDDQRRHGVRYQPSSEDMLTGPIQKLGLDPAKYTFIDYGAGKGRMPLVAARTGFRRSIGVEFSKELCAIMRRNIERMESLGALPIIPEVYEGDAAQFVPPDDDLVCYFYDPFDATIMSPILRQLSRRAQEDERDIRIIYRGPSQIGLFEASPQWRVISKDENCAIVESVSLPAVNAWQTAPAYHASRGSVPG